MRREAKGLNRMSELDWTGEGPRSTRFDDVYFQLADGLAESRAVFLDGCGLPGRFAGRRAFHVGELGFGTGLNIVALIDLWRRHRPHPDARLTVVSVEGYLISAEDAARALAAFPELAEAAAELLGEAAGACGETLPEAVQPAANSRMNIAPSAIKISDFIFIDLISNYFFMSLTIFS